MKLIFYAIMRGDYSVDFHLPGLTWFLHPLIRQEVIDIFLDTATSPDRFSVVGRKT